MKCILFYLSHDFKHKLHIRNANIDYICPLFQKILTLASDTTEPLLACL